MEAALALLDCRQRRWLHRFVRSRRLHLFLCLYRELHHRLLRLPQVGKADAGVQDHLPLIERTYPYAHLPSLHPRNIPPYPRLS